MANTVTWVPPNVLGTVPPIVSFALASGPSQIGPWTPLTQVGNDTTNSAIYNASSGVFYYVDAAGTTSTWYQLYAIDNQSQTGPATIFQAGGPAAIVFEVSAYKHSKDPGVAMYPRLAIDSAWGDVEPLMTPAQLQARHLFGIPLVSYQVDPITKTRQRMTEPLIADTIRRAVSIVETECMIEIMPRRHQEKMPFDRQQYASLGYMMIPTHPVQSLEDLSVVASDMETLYQVPPQWVEVAYIHEGQINIVPMTVAFQYGGFFVPSNSPNGGSAFLAILGQNPWIPAYWQIRYTTGFPNGKMPLIVNELIGVVAAMEILALLATTNARNSSHSVGMDGISQSVSTPGPQIYDARIDLLKEKREMLTGRVRSMFGTKMFTGVL